MQPHTGSVINTKKTYCFYQYIQLGHFKYSPYVQRKWWSDMGYSVLPTSISIHGAGFHGLDLRRITREKYRNAFECTTICIEMVCQNRICFCPVGTFSLNYLNTFDEVSSPSPIHDIFGATTKYFIGVELKIFMSCDYVIEMHAPIKKDNSKLYVKMIINGGMPLPYSVRICHWYGSCQHGCSSSILKNIDI